MRISIVLSSFAGGGAERVATVLANQLAASGEAITAITYSNLPDAYPVSFSVRRVRLTLDSQSKWPGAAMAANLRRIAGLRRALSESRPDVVVSMVDTTNVLTLLSSLGLGVPVVVSERTAATGHPLSRPWRILRSRLYPRAAAVVVLNERMREWAASAKVSAPVVVIPNPVWLPRVDRPRRRADDDARKLISVGRLHSDKGYDRLIAAFAACVAQYPNWTLDIYGEGPDRETLTRQISALGLADRVRLPGRVSDPLIPMRSADLYALTSRCEGMPNALLEAMACGLPVLSVDCATGPREVIRNGIDGVLIPEDDPETLALSLMRLMGDEGERDRLSSRAQDVYYRFGIETIVPMWRNLFRSVIDRQPVNQRVIGARYAPDAPMHGRAA